MKYLTTCFLTAFASFACFFSASAQEMSNRDSAAYYFQKGASFHEGHSRKIPKAPIDRQRRTAMGNYTTSIAFDSSYYWSYRNRGYCYERFGEYDLALADYNQAVLAGKRRGEIEAAFVHFNCLRLCIRLHQWSEAEAHCSTLLTNTRMCQSKADTFCRSLWLQRAEARTNLKKYEEAKQDYLIYQQLTAAQQKDLALAGAEEKPDNAKKLAQEAHMMATRLAKLDRIRSRYLVEPLKSHHFKY